MGKPKGDFESEVDAAYPALARAAVVLCWSKADAEDVVQETMLRMCKSYDSFRGDSSFLTWVYAILVRVAEAANRRRSKTLPAEYAAHQAQELPPVDNAVIDDENKRRMIDAIRSLPQRQREMITLHFLQELPYAEIAGALGVSVGTVKATVFAAKKSLRSALTATITPGSQP